MVTDARAQRDASVTASQNPLSVHPVYPSCTPPSTPLGTPLHRGSAVLATGYTAARDTGETAPAMKKAIDHGSMRPVTKVTVRSLGK